MEQAENGDQTYTIKGTARPAFHADLDDDVFTITLLSYCQYTGRAFEYGDLFSDISQRVNDDESVTLQFTLREGLSLLRKHNGGI